MNSSSNLNATATGYVHLKVIGCVYSVITLYLLITQVYIEVDARIFKKKEQKNSKRGRHLKLMQAAYIASLFSSFIRFFVKTLLIFKPVLSKIACAVLFQLGIVTIPMSAVFVYAILFIRHDILYQGKLSEQMLYVKIGRMTARIVFLFYLLSIFAFILIFAAFATVAVREKDDFCTIVHTKVDLAIPRIVLLTGMCITQIVLLILIVTPIIRHYGNTRNSVNSHSSKFVNLALKTFLIATICVTTDISTWSVVVAGIGKSVVPTLVNTSILVNNVSIAFTFSDWRVRLFPWRCHSVSPRKRRKSTVKVILVDFKGVPRPSSCGKT